MCQAFGTRVVGGLARALRMTLTPPDTLPEVCPEPIVRLCRLPVLSMHAMLDPIEGRPPREMAVAFGKFEVEPLLWQLYFEAVDTHDGKRAAIREARYGGPPDGLNATELKEHAAEP